MSTRVLKSAFVLVFVVFIAFCPWWVYGQANSGIIQGMVVDQTKGAVQGAAVRLQNPVSGHIDEVKTGADGIFTITNIPFNSYQLTVSAQGFNTFGQDLDVRSIAPIMLNISLTLGEVR